MAAFPNVPTFVRNDSFGPAPHNNLIQRQDFLYDFLAAEHDPATGEHNTPNVARTLGAVRWDGASYSLEGFNADVQSVGQGGVTAVLNLAPNRFNAAQGTLEVMPAGASGNTRPWLANAVWLSDRQVQVCCYENTAGTGAQQSFTATNSDFFLGIRSPQVANSTARPTGATRRLRGEGLRVSATDYNPLVQAMGSNRKAVLAKHTSAGLHNCREVAKVVGLVHFDAASNTYQVIAHRGLDAGVTRVTTGQARINLSASSPAMIAPVQAFAWPLSGVTAAGASLAGSGTGALNGNNTTGIQIATVPVGTCSPLTVDVFLYSYVVNLFAGTGTYTYRWLATDFDFVVAVHGA